ncbi:hypothetical protein QBC36DRAFT_306571 [Triangularia setosa]|uniref:Uncharacterized protein n=1 Tax=Triangularia setosa TaxID=2587417 RepID=A0AAN7AC92_9PEZI|nr:hypothetical protein QBC36DRAFT_306571 [Podospora setosa]
MSIRGAWLCPWHTWPLLAIGARLSAAASSRLSETTAHAMESSLGLLLTARSKHHPLTLVGWRTGQDGARGLIDGAADIQMPAYLCLLGGIFNRQESTNIISYGRESESGVISTGINSEQGGDDGSLLREKHTVSLKISELPEGLDGIARAADGTIHSQSRLANDPVHASWLKRRARIERQVLALTCICMQTSEPPFILQPQRHQAILKRL